MDLKERTHFKGVRHPWELARKRIISSLLSGLLDSVDTIVDIGSGDAFILQSLCARWNHLKGIGIDANYNDEILHLLRKELSDQIQLSRDLPRSIDGNRVFLLLDVIEHIENPVDWFLTVAQKLNLNSRDYVLLTVPAYQNLFGLHDRLLGHYRRYDSNDFKQFMAEAKLEVITSGNFFFSLWVVRSMQKLLGANRTDSEKGETDLTMMHSRLWASMVSGCLWADYQFAMILRHCGLRVPGLSLYALCRPIS